MELREPCRSGAPGGLPVQPVKVIAVTSGKGGVGKSTVSVNLALALAGLGRRVLLFDADLGLANIDVMLGLRSAFNLAHVVRGECTLEQAIVEGPRGVRIVPGASGIRAMAELPARAQAGLVHAFGTLASVPEVLIVDTPAGIGGPTVNFCAAAQEVIVVLCDDPASLADAYATIKVLCQDTGRSRFRVLVNMARDPQEGLAPFHKLARISDRFLDVVLDLVAVLPYDACVLQSLRGRRALLDAYPRSPAAAAFKKLAERADKWPVPGSASGRIEFFVERVIQAGAPTGRLAQA